MALSAMLILWVAAPSNGDQASVLARVEALGGVVERDPNLPGNPVVQVSLQATSASDADLEQLVELKGLRRLYLGYGTRTTDAGLAHVGRLTNLELLAMPETAITDAGLAHLKPLSKLKNLGLLFCKGITDGGLVHLRGLRGLRQVSFDGTRVTERGVAELQRSLPDAYLSGGRKVLPADYPTRAQRRTALAAQHKGLDPAMLDFLSFFDGTPEGVEAALKGRLGARADVSDLVGVMLERPRVTRTERKGATTCYIVAGKQGMALGTYRVCWRGGKLQAVKRLALKLDPLGS